MIFSLSMSCALPLLATIVCVAFSMSLVSGIPVSQPPEGIENMRYCSTLLDSSIKLICHGKTKSLADLYPESFGQRKKRSSPDEPFFRPFQNGPIHLCCLHPCGYSELRQYCADDADITRP